MFFEHCIRIIFKDHVTTVMAAENSVCLYINHFLLTQTEHPSPHPKMSPSFRGPG